MRHPIARAATILLLSAVLAGGLLAARTWQIGPRPAIPASALVAPAGDLQIALQVGALSKGQRVIEAWVSDGGGRPVPAPAVALRFSMPFICADVIDVALAPIADGHFRASGAFFGMAGSWIADVAFEDGAGAPRQARLVVPVNTTDVVAPFSADEPPGPALLAAGRQLYAANCASCHGAAGRGDGPRSAALTPRPTDLSAHMVAGKHTDEQTFLTLSNGRPGTAMPAWGGSLSPDELWQLTAYIRTFARPAPAGPATDSPGTPRP